MTQNTLKFFISIFLLFSTLSCNILDEKLKRHVHQGESKWEYPVKLEDSNLIPIGRRKIADNSVKVTLDGMVFKSKIYTDKANSNWIVIPRRDPLTKGILNISIENKDKDINHAFIAALKDPSLWLGATYLIDSNHSLIKETSEKLFGKIKDRNSKAMAIQQFVRENIEPKEYIGHFSKKASKSLQDGFGTCVNRARLFVALCRASGVPARTIWGYFYILPEANHEGHHEWAEYLNDDNQWIAIELDKRLYHFKNIDKPYIGHFDLVYAAEENPIFLLASKHNSKILYMSNNGSWLNGKFGYEIKKNSYPNSFTIENIFELY